MSEQDSGFSGDDATPGRLVASGRNLIGSAAPLKLLPRRD